MLDLNAAKLSYCKAWIEIMDDQYTDRYSMPKPIDFVPKRVVSLVPSITESLFDLDLG